MISRWKAFTYHLTISASIAIGVSALVLMLWYTPPFFAAIGGQKILVILLLIDVVLGPLITLIIFNSNKSRRELTFDLSIIAFVQTLALIYGMSVMFQGRPVYAVFVNDTFILVRAVEISDSDLAQSQYPDFKSLPLTGPIYVYSEMPTDRSKLSDLESYLLDDKDLPYSPQYYKPYTDHSNKAGHAAKPMSVLIKMNGDRVTEINDAIQHSGRAETDLGFLPLRAQENDLTVMVNKSDGKVLAILQMRPW